MTDIYTKIEEDYKVRTSGGALGALLFPPTGNDLTKLVFTFQSAYWVGSS